MTAPSPIVRRAPRLGADSPRRRRAAPPRPLRTRRRRDAADRHRPVRDRHRGARTRNSGAPAAARSATSCSRKPGITGSSFAPGASSRPIVRGLDSYRVRIQENGIGANGVSELGEDHAVPIDPLAADRVEVVRGPATLRWGSQAIGGVVNATNNRIPDALPCRADAPASQRWLPTKAPAPGAMSGPCVALRDQRRRHHRRQRPRRRRRCSMPATATSPSTPTPSAGAPTTTASRAIRICRRADQTLPFNGRQPNSSLRVRRPVGRRLLHLRRRLCRRRGHAMRASIASPASKRRRPTPAST